MSELTIRRNRGPAGAVRYQGTGKGEKAGGSGQAQKAAGTAAVTVSETLRQLMTRGAQAESHIRESRRTLQAGEAVLAEVQDKLARIAELAQESAGGGEPDRAALQTEVDRLLEEIDRVMRGAVVGDMQLFLDDEEGAAEAGMEALLRAAGSAGQGGARTLPDWLMRGVAQSAPDPEQLLRGLGLDKTASGEQLLAAIGSSPLGGNSAAGYLAALYLGAVIAGGDLSGEIDVGEALDGLQQLLEKVAGGAAPDQALAELTDGVFTSFQDFEAQFTGGTAPGLENFLVQLLLSDSSSLLSTDVSLLALLAGVEGGSLELMLGLLTAAQSGESGREAAAGAEQDWGGGLDRSPAAAEPSAVLRAGEAQVTGRDLSGVSFDSAAGELTVSGRSDAAIQGSGQGRQMIRLAGPGIVTLERANVSTLTVAAAGARVASGGESLLGELHLEEGAELTVSGSGLLRIGSVRSDGANTLRLIGGALAVTEKNSGSPGVLTVPVVLEGPAFLSAHAESVRSVDGRRLEPFDIVWRTLLPGWSSITALGLDGRLAKMSHLGPDSPLRLWLEKGELTHGYPVHAVVLQGEDEFGRPRTRYAYLRWSQQAGAFQEITLYPNPFTVTGGEQERDWVYEEGSHTLRILTPQVRAISGGVGTAANQEPFSGRVALADGIGEVALTLDGVVCRVSSGRAFSLGRGNSVTLFLQGGTDNLFESGAGCAGISLGDGASVRIERAGTRDGGTPVGSLTAVGGAGGAGIGRDSGRGQDRVSQITICGGAVTASGTGGGAGIGAGKHCAMGSITITGGQVEAAGGPGGGAGIGGALGGPVGDISIRGGTVTATAAYHAAAIGAGIQGESGDILITGTARIAKALGGNPGADIGACLFGGCGKVLISGSADIGSAMPWTRTGISLQMGEDTQTLPQFRLSARALQLNRLCVLTRERAQATQLTLDADCRWIAQIQAAYQALSHQLEQNFSNLHSGSGGASEGPLRDNYTASTLLSGMRQSILLQSSQALRTHSGRGREDVWQLLW